jgi:hypothetical protein
MMPQEFAAIDSRTPAFAGGSEHFRQRHRRAGRRTQKRIVPEHIASIEVRSSIERTTQGSTFNIAWRPIAGFDFEEGARGRADPRCDGQQN